MFDNREYLARRGWDAQRNRLMHRPLLSIAAPQSAVSASQFCDVSRVFCDDYRLVDLVSPMANELPLFDGDFGLGTLSSGINFSRAAITALRDSTHSVVFPASLSIVLAVEGRPSELHFGSGAEAVRMRAGETGLFSFRDDEELTGSYARGASATSALIQLRPDDLEDEELAGRVRARCAATSARLFSRMPDMAALGAKLFMSRRTGVVAKLLVESAVLEIVARCLDADGAASERRKPTFAPHTDRVRVARVRDRLVAEPGGDHTLTSLAREAGLSVSSLKVKFRAAYGESVFDCLHRIRMNVAREGIERQSWSVRQAAHAAGYRHVSNFSTAYRRQFGASPRGRT
jgi:AraC-like DNA-binding protein